jgi:thiol-disulfide isomerase/thioredoxin
MKKLAFTIFINCLLLLPLVKAQNANLKARRLKYLPDIDVYDIHGKHTTLRQLGKNKVLFIDSWFVPCPPCFREMRILHKLYSKYYSNKNFCFITICRTDSALVKKFIAQDKSMIRYVNMYHDFSHLKDFKLPVYFIPGCNERIFTGEQFAKYTPDDKTKCPDAQFGFHGYPTIIIFDKTGKRIFKRTGYSVDNEDADDVKIENAIKKALAVNK